MDNVFLYARTFPSVFFCAIACGLLAALVLINARFRTAVDKLFIPVSSQSTGYFSPLDAFRGFAALWVASFHLWQFLVLNKKEGEEFFLSNGVNAVGLFAVLSAFVIYHSLFNKVHSLDDVISFFRRRLLRIYPLYLVTTAVLLLSGYLSSGALIRELFMLKTFTYGPFINPVTWSLQVEVLFYLMLPLLLIIFGDRLWLPALAGVIAFSLYPDAGREISMIKFFCFGILCSKTVTLPFFSRINQFAANLLFTAGAVLLIAGLPAKQPLNIVIAMGFSLLLLGSLKSRLFGGMLSAKPFRFLGTISYSIFLWHIFVISMDSYFEFDVYGITTLGGVNPGQYRELEPILASASPLTIFILYIPALVLLSSLSYLIIEKPFHKLKYKDREESSTGHRERQPDLIQFVHRHWKFTGAALLLLGMTGHSLITRNLPVHPFQYCLAGISYLEANKPEKAVQELQSALALKPDLAAGYKYLASAYEMQKKVNEATNTYELYLRLEPRDREARDRLLAIRAAYGTP